MDINQIHKKWSKVSQAKKIKNYKALRISSECISELFIGIDSDGYRCLLMFLNVNVLDLKIRGVDKDKLSLSYLPENRLIITKLKDVDFTDLFNDLILSIYSKIDLISDSKKAAKEFITTFYKWAHFFEDTHSDKLGEEQIQGLFGELFVLNRYLKKSNPSTINLILASWKGPYDAAKDFEFDMKDVEVKTKKESKLFVKISSEFQLEKGPDKDLELLVASVKIDLIKGKSIHDMLLEITKQVRGSLGDISILYKALNQKALTVENLKQYNNYRFIVEKTELFDAGKNNFPKLSISNVANGISNLKYKLRITQLDEFLIELKKY